MSTNASALPALLAERGLPLSNSITEFRAAFPSGRIVTEQTAYNAQDGYVVMYARVYRQEYDVEPAATAHCEGRRDFYADIAGNLLPDWLERTEETAIARALYWMGFGDGKRVFADLPESEA